MKTERVKHLEKELEGIAKRHFTHCHTPEERARSYVFYIRRQTYFWKVTKADEGEGRNYYPNFRWINGGKDDTN